MTLPSSSGFSNFTVKARLSVSNWLGSQKTQPCTSALFLTQRDGSRVSSRSKQRDFVTALRSRMLRLPTYRGRPRHERQCSMTFGHHSRGVRVATFSSFKMRHWYLERELPLPRSPDGIGHTLGTLGVALLIDVHRQTFFVETCTAELGWIRFRSGKVEDSAVRR
jgi:hypothetical protein